MRLLLNTDGTVSTLTRKHSITEIQNMIGAQALDTVTFRQQTIIPGLDDPSQPGLSFAVPAESVLYVDDLGHHKGLPMNPVATAIYWAKCRPDSNPLPIVGVAVLVPIADFD